MLSFKLILPIGYIDFSNWRRSRITAYVEYLIINLEEKTVSEYLWWCVK